MKKELYRNEKFYILEGVDVFGLKYLQAFFTETGNFWTNRFDGNLKTFIKELEEINNSLPFLDY